MFNADFWPTPPHVADQMIEALDLDMRGKTILEPSAGAGNLVLALKAKGATEVIACEKDDRLRKILEHECRVIGSDFLAITSDQISHIHAIVMNPPFWGADRHIKHAWEIAPPGCVIIALCNSETLKNQYTRGREHLSTLVNSYGYSVELGDCFSKAERKTEVEVSMIWMKRPAATHEAEFAGFFMEEDPEQNFGEGIMQYDAIRDIVNRYVAAVKLYEHQIDMGVQMRTLTDLFPAYRDKQGKEENLHYLTCKKEKAEQYRADFKKGLQKRAWKFIFDKLDMDKYSTRSLKEDINKFVEHQVNIPFTMRNIYRMLEIVVGTTGSRMDKALEEVFDKVTMHSKDNRYNVEGWVTNSDYLLNKRFIMDYMCEKGWGGEMGFRYYHNGELIVDFCKALCYMTGQRYEDIRQLSYVVKGTPMEGKTDNDYHVKYENAPQWGKWFDWGFFRVRAYMKGTMHFEFKDEAVWEQFNAHIARIKGYPLPPSNKRRKSYQSNFYTDKQDAA